GFGVGPLWNWRCWPSGIRWPFCTCGSSNLNPSEFIGGFERLAIACVHGDADKRSAPGRPKRRTPDPHRAAVGIDRAAPSNRRAPAPPNSSPVLSSLGSAVLSLVLALVASMARR